MEGYNQNRHTNSLREHMREQVLAVMRTLEATAEANGGTIPPALQRHSITQTETRRMEGDHMVSTVRVRVYVQHQTLELAESSLENIRHGDDVHLRIDNLLENILRENIDISENIDIRELDNEWRGEDVVRLRVDGGGVNVNVNEDYLTTFTFPENTIVFRYIQDNRQTNQGLDILIPCQIIWNSRFTWRQIKQHLEDYSYNYHFKFEFITINGQRSNDIEPESHFTFEIIQRSNDIVEESEESESGDTVEEVADWDLPLAVDGLPSAVINEESESESESESSDGTVMCAICQEKFSSRLPAKQLPCKHLYHSECILLWFRQKNSCPMCRCEPVLQGSRDVPVVIDQDVVIQDVD